MHLLHRVKSELGRQAMSKLQYDKFLPKLIAEEGGASSRLGALATDLKMSHVLVVTDAVLLSLGIVQPCIKSLEDAGIHVVVFSGVLPDPSIGEVMQGASVYLEHGCDGVVAIGGGSSIDCAKAIAAHVVDPKPIEEIAGVMKLKKRPAKLIAIPTTAGTGSEATYAAVISSPGRKFLITDFKMIPRGAILDPRLSVNLPAPVTAATGMDALTHAVEAYLSPWGSSYSDEKCMYAVKTIMTHLVPVFQNGNSMQARAALLQASYCGGIAVSCCGVGYVHSIAHSLGGIYHTPHGEANAMILPHVLKFYGTSAHAKLAKLARVSGLVHENSKNDSKDAKVFIAKIEAMNKEMNLATTVKGLLPSGCDEIATLALAEAHGEQHSMIFNFKEFIKDAGYPCIKYMSHNECKQIVGQFAQAARL